MTVQTPLWLFAISIIAPAVVSIVSIFIPIWLEKQKADREDARREVERQHSEVAEIDLASIELLKILSVFRGKTIPDIAHNLEGSGIATNAARATSILLSKFYIWESKVWEKLSVTDRQSIRDMRSKIEVKEVPPHAGPHIENPFAEELPKIVEQVLLLTRRAAGRE